MANTRKLETIVSNEDVENTVKNIDNTSILEDSEKTKLQDRVNKLESMIEELLNQKNTSPAVQIIDTTSKMDRPCTIIHLLECSQGLPTSIELNGNLHYFYNFGERKTFRFADMQNITTKYRDWFSRGIFTLGEDCSEMEADFGIQIMQMPMNTATYKKIADMDNESFKILIEGLNGYQRVLLAKTWAQRYYNKDFGYNDINKIRILNKYTKGNDFPDGILKSILDESVNDD